MKTIKTFALGLIIGLCISITTPVVANHIYEAVINPFPVKVDNKITNIEGYNINGSTYFKLRDIGDFANFSTDFKDGEIIITTQNNNSEQNTSIACATEAPEGATIIRDNTARGDIYNTGRPSVLHFENGEWVIGIYDANLILKNTSLTTYRNKTTNLKSLRLENKDTKEILLDSIPFGVSFGYSDGYMSLDYFDSTVLPLDRSFNNVTE